MCEKGISHMGLTFRGGRVAEMVLGKGGGRHKCLGRYNGVCSVLAAKREVGDADLLTLCCVLLLKLGWVGFGCVGLGKWTRVGLD